MILHKLADFPVKKQALGSVAIREDGAGRAGAFLARWTGPTVGPVPVLPLALGLAIGGGVWLQHKYGQREQQLEALVAERTRSLHDAHLQVRTLFLNSPLAICLATPAGAILAVNLAMTTLTGYSEAELERANAFDLCDASELKDRLHEGRTGGLVVQIVTKQGRRVHTDLYVSRIGGMDKETMLWVFEDVSEHIQARDKLQETYGILHRRHRIAEGMRDVMVALNSSQPLPQVLKMIAMQAQDLLGATSVVIGVLDDEAETLLVQAQCGPPLDTAGPTAGGVPYVALRRAIARGDSLIYPDPDGEQAAQLLGEVLVAPIFVAAADYAGSLLLFYPDRRSIAVAETELATLFAAQAALAIENAQLKASAQEMATINERNRVARELHDSVTQSLYGIILNSDATLLALDAGNSEKAEQRLRQLKEIAREAMTETRLLIYQLRPFILEEQGLIVALRERLEAVEVRSGIEVELQIEGDPTLSPEVESELFRAILEGLNNVIKHARAKHVQLQIVMQPECCLVVLTDDGTGFDVATSARYGGYGLKTIEERLHQIGGTLTIWSEPGEGTRLEMEAPL